jgi:hypothetical protein
MSSLSINSPAPLNYSMADGNQFSYDNRVFKTENQPWYKRQQAMGLVKNPMFVPQGTPLPLKHEEQYVALPVDSMFYFAHNTASPYCRSTFSTSTGQVCTMRDQTNFIAERRGNNKNYPNGEF